MGSGRKFCCDHCFFSTFGDPRKYLWQTGIVGAVGGGGFGVYLPHRGWMVVHPFFLRWQLHLWHIFLQGFLKRR